MKKTTVVALLLLASPLAASAEGGAHGFDWTAFLGRVFNAAVLFGALFVLLRKPVAGFFAKRSREVRQGIEARQEEIARAGDRLQGIDDRLGRLEAEIAAIRLAADEGGKAEMARLDEAGRQEAERILQLADAQIRQRVDVALRQLKERIADLAIERFRDEMKGALDEPAQRRVIDRNIRQSGELHERE